MKSIELSRTDNINFIVPVLYETKHFVIHYSIGINNRIYTITHLSSKTKILQLNNFRKAKKIVNSIEKSYANSDLLETSDHDYESKRTLWLTIHELINQFEVKDFTFRGNYL